MWSLICCWPKRHVINNDLSTWKIKDKIACVFCVRVTRIQRARNYKWSHGIYIHVHILCGKRKTKCLEKINFARKIIRARRFRYPYISCGLLLYTYVQWPYLFDQDKVKTKKFSTRQSRRCRRRCNQHIEQHFQCTDITINTYMKAKSFSDGSMNKPLKKTHDNEFFKHVPNNLNEGSEDVNNADSFKIRSL